MRARVVSVRPFGVFVALPKSRLQALVHHSQVAEEVQFGKGDSDEARIHALEYFCPRASEVWVKITGSREGEGGAAPKLSSSMRAVNQDTGEDLDPTGALIDNGGGGANANATDEVPTVGSIHRGTVQSIRPFGVFVRLEGFRRQGLVHASQISDHLFLGRDDTDEEKAAEIGAVLAVGEPVWVKVVEVDENSERGGPPRIGCSIKLVSQRDGTDLDPGNAKYQPRGSTREARVRKIWFWMHTPRESQRT